jgi:hypothetical protein
MRLPYRLAAPALGLFVLSLCGPVGQAADETPKGQPLDTRVASSGPIHEAFAAPRPSSLDAPPLVEKAPPKPLKEEIPDEKPEGDNVQWIPGYWDHDAAAGNFVWVSGVWRIPPPARQWAAGYWVKADNQWRRQPGFWAAFNETDKSQEVVYYPKPPEAKGENLDDAPANKVFAPGSWTYGASGYTWNPGQYVNAAPGWSWTAANYSWTPAGYTYTRGYWDYSFARRGLAYAPVTVPQGVRNVANYYYRPTRVIAPNTFAKSLTLAGNGRGYNLSNARIVPAKNVTGMKVVPVTAAQRAEFQALSRKLNQSAVTRSRLEAKGTASLKTGPIRRTLDLPRPKATAANVASRFQPPARPTAHTGTATPAKKTPAPAPGAKKGPAKKPAAPPAAKKEPAKKAAPPAAKKEPAKKAAPPAHPKKEPAKKKDEHKGGGKPEHKKK